MSATHGPPSSSTSVLTRAYQRNLKALTKATLGSSKRIARQVQRGRARSSSSRRPARATGSPAWRWGRPGRGRYHLYRPPGLQLAPGEKLPLMVMLHGCGQTGRDFAISTRMNRARRARALPGALPRAGPPGQSRRAAGTGTTRRSGKADAEAATLMAAVDQVCLLYPVDRERVAVAGPVGRRQHGGAAGHALSARASRRWPCIRAWRPVPRKSTATALGAMRGRHVPPMPATAVGKAMGAAAVVRHACRRCWCCMAMPTAWWRRAMPAAAPRSGPWPPARGPAPRGRCSAASAIRCASPTSSATAAPWSRCARSPGWAMRGAAAPRGMRFSDAAGPDASKLVWAFAARQFRRTMATP